jgi:hypothetical protein
MMLRALHANDVNAQDFASRTQDTNEKNPSLSTWIFGHTLTKSIHTASFFEIDPCFSVGG